MRNLLSVCTVCGVFDLIIMTLLNKYPHCMSCSSTFLQKIIKKRKGDFAIEYKTYYMCNFIKLLRT